MKTKTFLPFVLFVTICLACVTDQFTNTQINSEVELQENWKTTELTGAFYNNLIVLSHYQIDAEKLRDITLNTLITKFRFTLELNQNQELQIEVAGVDQNGAILSSFSSIINTDSNIKNSIDELQSSTYAYDINPLDLSLTDKHLLPYKNAYTYINNWEESIQHQQIESLITYNGERIRYFSTPKEVVKAMVSPQKVTSIALFLGLNDTNKLTTVFIQKNSAGSLLLNTAYNKSGIYPEDNEGDIYDFTKPCPTVCDPIP
jgi:hypothetical protein